MPSARSLAQFERAGRRFQIIRAGSRAKTIVAINHRRKPLDDVRVRRAISHAIDRKAFIEGVLEGGTVDDDGGMLGEGDNAEKDPMYDQAVEVVLKNRKASISLVQRHLKIGYNRAARLVEDMEKAGLVSSMSGSGQREILVPARAE